MMTRWTLGLLVVFVASISLARAAEPELFFSRPAPPSWWARSGENWLALFAAPGGKRFDLKAVQSKVYVDSRDGIIKLGAQNSPDPLAFLANTKLKTGPLEVATELKVGVPLSLTDSDAIEFVFRKEKWKLSRKTLAKKQGAVDYVLADISYHLTRGATEIELGHSECRLFLRSAETVCTEKVAISFVGDLDRDGTPDLLMLEAPNRQGSDSMSLLLSSIKKPIGVANAEELRTQPKPFQAVVRKSGKDEGTLAKTPEILITGRFMPATKNSFTFDTWYAFFNDQKKLESVRIWVACLQGQCEESQRIEISKSEAPLFLVRGVSGLKPTTLKEATSQVLPRDPEKDAEFDSYDLEFAGEKFHLTGGIGVLTLESSKKKTVFPLKTLDPDDKPKLIWSGDLNADGKLDLYFEVKQDAGLAHLLYISPEAATGPITGPTARTCTGDCG